MTPKNPIVRYEVSGLEADRELIRSLESKLGVATVRRADAFDGVPSDTTVNLAAIRTALEAGGIIFVEENGEGPGVRLRKDRV